MGVGLGRRRPAVDQPPVNPGRMQSLREEATRLVQAPRWHMRLGEQVAAAITFLLSDDAANINGAILPCDGGWSAI